MRIVFTILLSSIISGFSYSQKTIDLAGNISKKKSINLSEIAVDVQYIPIETTDECLLSDELKVLCTEEYIFIGDSKNECFYRFDHTGKLLNKIGKKGGGPGEFSRCLNFFVDEAEEKIYLVSSFSDGYIYKYEFNGDFIERIPMDIPTWTIEILNKKIYGYNYFFNNIITAKELSKYELYLFDDKGKLLKQVPTSVTNKKDDVVLIEMPLFYYYDNSIHYKNTVSDIVYRLDENIKKTPRYEIKTGGKSRHDENDWRDMKKYVEKLTISWIFENDNIILIRYADKSETNSLYINKLNWDTSTVIGKDGKPGFTDDIKKGPNFIVSPHNGSHKNYLVSIIAQDRYSELKNTDLIGKSVSEDDNPVIVIAKLR